MGPAHFDYRFPQYRPTDTPMQADPVRVHNDYLNTLVDWGLAGGAIVASAWVLFFTGVFRSWKFVQRAQHDFAAKRSNNASFVMGGWLGLMAILLHSWVDFNMHIPSNAILAVTLMALVSGYFRFSTESYWHTVRGPLRILVSVALVSGLVYLGTQSWRQSAQCYWQGRAEAAPAYSDEQIAAFQRAFAVDEKDFETAYRIGECFRMRSWQGGEGYQALAEKAIEWFRKGLALNPYGCYDFLRWGMCLDWLGQHDEALVCFEKALALDPNSYYVQDLLGWHYAQVEDWLTARQWFQKSLGLLYAKNTIALSYLKIVEEKIAATPATKPTPRPDPGAKP